MVLARVDSRRIVADAAELRGRSLFSVATSAGRRRGGFPLSGKSTVAARIVP